MIDWNFGQEKLEQIENQLIDYDETIGITVQDIRRPSANWEWLYLYNTYSLPSNVSRSTDLIIINEYYFQAYYEGIKDSDKRVQREGVEANIQWRLDNCVPWEDISCAINDRVHALIDRYGRVLDATRKLDRLFGINDEEKILINHHNLYQEVLKSNDKQIEFFDGIVLNKEISDIITGLFVDFIRKRLQLLNPQLVDEASAPLPSRSPVKLVWNGNQKQLLELITSLQENGWVNQFKIGSLKQVSNSICQLFDLSKTRSIDGSDTSNSFYQILKGETDISTGKRSYQNVFGSEYNRSFSEINKNPNS